MPDVPVADSDAVDALLRDGDLAGARDMLAARLRGAPDDAQARMYLFQLLCVDGDLDRARTQLRTLATLSPAAQMLAAAYGQAIDATAARGATDAAPPLLAGTAAHLDPATAPDTPGAVDGRRFDYLFDGDTRYGPAIEAIVGGRLGLIPFAAIETIETEGPVDLRDLVWLPAEIRLRDGAGLAALLPVTYPGTAAAADPALRLARRTEWHERDGGVRGIGQRVWTLSDGEDVPILGFRRIRFDAAA